LRRRCHGAHSRRNRGRPGARGAALHYLSPRHEFPFIPVNCGALPDNLLEANCSATSARVHRRKKASCGLVGRPRRTLLLDEVEAMTPARGKSCCCVSCRITPTGGSRASDLQRRPAHRRIQQCLSRGDGSPRPVSPRSPFRFGILTVTMPPLRERGRDAVLLAEIFSTFATPV